MKYELRSHTQRKLLSEACTMFMKAEFLAHTLLLRIGGIHVLWWCECRMTQGMAQVPLLVQGSGLTNDVANGEEAYHACWQSTDCEDQISTSTSLVRIIPDHRHLLWSLAWMCSCVAQSQSIDQSDKRHHHNGTCFYIRLRHDSEGYENRGWCCY